MKLGRSAYFLGQGLLALAGFLFIPSSAHALAVSATLTNTTIPFENNGLPNGVTIQYTLTGQTADLHITVYKVQNASDALNETNQVAVINKLGTAVGSGDIFWNGLWLIQGDNGRQNGTYKFVVQASTSDTNNDFVFQYTIPTLLQIQSVDIHGLNVAPSTGENGQPSFPYLVSYALAKDSLVSIVIRDAAGATVRNLLKNRPQSGEATQALNTVSWNGIDDDGRAVPIGIYSVSVDATDPTTGDTATTRTKTAAIQSLANINTDPKQIFENSAFAFPNPTRNGQCTIQFQGVRDNSTVYLKIYTINGDLVLAKSFSNPNAGTVTQFAWNLTNESGKKVGRGLYFYSLREESSAGTLQTVKKVAVIQ